MNDNNLKMLVRKKIYIDILKANKNIIDFNCDNYDNIIENLSLILAYLSIDNNEYCIMLNGFDGKLRYKDVCLYCNFNSDMINSIKKAIEKGEQNNKLIEYIKQKNKRLLDKKIAIYDFFNEIFDFNYSWIIIDIFANRYLYNICFNKDCTNDISYIIREVPQSLLVENIFGMIDYYIVKESIELINNDKYKIYLNRYIEKLENLFQVSFDESLDRGEVVEYLIKLTSEEYQNKELKNHFTPLYPIGVLRGVFSNNYLNNKYIIEMDDINDILNISPYFLYHKNEEYKIKKINKLLN